MRIAVDVRCLDTIEKTGVGEYTASLLEALLKENTSHTFLLYSNAHRCITLPNFSGKNKLIFGNIPNKLLNACLITCNQPKLDQYIQKRTDEKPDIFFSPNLNFTALRDTTKHILMVHDISFILFPEYYTLKQRIWHRLANLKKQINKATHVITPSEHTKNDLIKHLHVPSEKITVIPPGIPSFLHKPTISQLVLPDNYIVSIGTIEPRKNSINIITAFEAAYSRLPKNYTLIIAGAHGSNTSKLIKRIEKSPIKHAIRYLGYTSEDDKKLLYEKAQLVLYPSLYEGFGFPILESIATGVPVITSNRSSLPEVADNAAYYVNPHHPEEMTEGIIRLLNQPELANDLRQKGLARAQRYSWNIAAKSWLSLVENL